MNTAISNLNDNQTTTVNSNLLAYLHTGNNSPQAVEIFEKELTEVAMRVLRGDLSDMEKILSNQVINLNNLFTRFAISADALMAEQCTKDAEIHLKLALQCQDKAMKGIAQLAKMKAPKKGSVYIRTVNQQVNNASPEPKPSNISPTVSFR